MSPGFQAFMAHTLDFQHGCLTSVRGCVILMRAGDRGRHAWQTFATVMDRRRLNSSLLPRVPSTWTPTGGLSSATIDAWASIREGMQSADLELAALAGPGSESTGGSVLVGVGLGAVSEARESDSLRPAAA